MLLLLLTLREGRAPKPVRSALHLSKFLNTSVRRLSPLRHTSHQIRGLMTKMIIASSGGDIKSLSSPPPYSISGQTYVRQLLRSKIRLSDKSRNVFSEDQLVKTTEQIALDTTPITKDLDSVKLMINSTIQTLTHALSQTCSAQHSKPKLHTQKCHFQ